MKPKNKFSGKGKAILAGTKPTGISDFLASDETKNVGMRKYVKKERSHNGNTDIRASVNTDNRGVDTSSLTDVNNDARINLVTDTAKVVDAYQRVELKLPIDLAERLRAYAFHSRTTKTATIARALNELFEKEQFTS
jgi:hypothetical protein